MSRQHAEPRTVLHATEVWLPQTQTWLAGLVRGLPADWRSVVVAGASENLDQFPADSLIVRRVNHGPRLLSRVRRRLLGDPYGGFAATAIARRRPAIVHAHFGHVGWLTVAAARRAGAVHITSFYGLDVARLPTQDARWQARYAELFAATNLSLALGPWMANRLVALGCPPERVAIHHLGVDVEAISFAPRERDPGRPVRILIAGAFREKKGIPDGIAAVARARRSVAAELTIVGGVSDDPASRSEGGRIEAAIERADARSWIHLAGFRPHRELFEIASRHDLFLAPSRTASDGDTEGTPMAILEMAAAGLPVISTRHADIPDLIADGETGVLAPEADPAALGDAIVDLVAASERWAEMARRARARIEADFDQRRQGERLAAIYERLLR